MSYPKDAWLEAAVLLVSKYWAQSRMVYFDYDTGEPLEEPYLPDDMDEIRDQAREYLEKNKFIRFELGTASSGACDTCWHEYPAIVFYGGRGGRKEIFDIGMDYLEGGLSAVYEAMREAEEAL